MHLTVGNVLCTLTKSTSRERKALDELLSFRVPGAQYSEAYRRGHWDGHRHLYNDTSGTFLAGLLPMVHKGLAKRGVRVVAVDGRSRPVERVELPDRDEWFSLLRGSGLPNVDAARCNLQVQGILAAVTKSWRHLAWPRGIIQLPTGTGKTILAAGLIQALYELPCLFVVDRRDALWQTKEVFEKILDEDIGIIGDGRLELKPHTVATIQTISAHLENNAFKDYLSTIDLLIIDECHKVGDNVYSKTLRKIPAYYRIGLSATALEKENLDTIFLIGATGGLLFDFTATEAVKRGFLAQPVIRFKQIKKPTVVVESLAHLPWKKRRHAASKVFREVYKQGIIENDYRNKKIVRIAKRAVAKGWPTLVLVRSLRHGTALAKALRRSVEGRVAYLHGSHATSRRKDTVSRFKRGRVDLLISSTIFDEAIDIPSVRCLILAGAGKSPIKAIQRVGRGMRRKEGENVLHVVDFLDRTHRYLLEHSLDRIRTYEKKNFRVEVPDLSKLQDDPDES